MSNRIGGVLVILLALGTVSGFILYFQTNQENLVLQREIQGLNQNLNRLTAELSNSEEAVETIQTQLDRSEREIDTLTQDKQQWISKYNQIQTQYSDLEYDYETVHEFSTLMTDLTVGNSLNSYYDALRMDFGPKGTLRSYRDYDEVACKFAACLTLHDLHELYWVDAEEAYGEDVGQTSYEQAWVILDTAVDHSGVNSWDSEEVKVEKILDFIYMYISYESEIDDSQMSPAETLSMRSGDCDDFTVLAAAMFEAVDIESAIAYFDGPDGGHAMTLVHLDDLGEYGYWSYSDLTNYELMEGKWIMIEPQSPIEYQNDDSLSDYEIYMAVEVDYEKASS